MILPNLTRHQHAAVLCALTRITGLSDAPLIPVFMDADTARIELLDPMKAIRQESYRANAYGHAAEMVERRTGRRVVLDLAAGHQVPIDVAGLILGAAVGLRLDLALRRTRSKPQRHRLTTRVAGFDTPGPAKTDLEAARRWAREMGRAARRGA